MPVRRKRAQRQSSNAAGASMCWTDNSPTCDAVSLKGPAHHQAEARVVGGRIKPPSDHPDSLAGDRRSVGVAVEGELEIFYCLAGQAIAQTPPPPAYHAQSSRSGAGPSPSPSSWPQQAWPERTSFHRPPGPCRVAGTSLVGLNGRRRKWSSASRSKSWSWRARRRLTSESRPPIAPPRYTGHTCPRAGRCRASSSVNTDFG